MKCVLRVGSSQRSPRIMCAWERMCNFITSKRICGLNFQYVFIVQIILHKTLRFVVAQICFIFYSHNLKHSFMGVHRIMYLLNAFLV